MLHNIMLFRLWEGEIEKKNVVGSSYHCGAKYQDIKIGAVS